MGNLGLPVPRNAGSMLSDAIETTDNAIGVPDISPRMAGQAFQGLKRGQGIAALLGLTEAGLSRTNTGYGNKVKAARAGMDATKENATNFIMSKLGL